MIDVEKTVKEIIAATRVEVEGYDNSDLVRAILKTFEAEVIVNECQKRIVEKM